PRGPARRLRHRAPARSAGTRADVIRLAVPPRHARVEREPVPDLPVMTVEPPDESGWAAYGRGAQFLAALRDGRAARAVWQALPGERWVDRLAEAALVTVRSEEHTSELQSRENLVCRLLLEKKKR